MNTNSLLRVFLVISAIGLPTFGGGEAKAATTVYGSFTGAPFFNSAYVVFEAELDLDNFAFDNTGAGGYAHNWWYMAGAGISSVTATVTGSVTPAYNGTFLTSAFHWVRIYSNSSTPLEALTDGASFADLGNNGSDPNAPSDGGIGRLQLGVGAGGGELVASNVISDTVPEPSLIGMGALACALVMPLRRRR